MNKLIKTTLLIMMTFSVPFTVMAEGQTVTDTCNTNGISRTGAENLDKTPETGPAEGSQPRNTDKEVVPPTGT